MDFSDEHSSMMHHSDTDLHDDDGEESPGIIDLDEETPCAAVGPEIVIVDADEVDGGRPQNAADELLGYTVKHFPGKRTKLHADQRKWINAMVELVKKMKEQLQIADKENQVAYKKMHCLEKQLEDVRRKNNKHRKRLWYVKNQLKGVLTHSNLRQPLLDSIENVEHRERVATGRKKALKPKVKQMVFGGGKAKELGEQRQQYFDREVLKDWVLQIRSAKNFAACFEGILSDPRARRHLQRLVTQSVRKFERSDTFAATNLLQRYKGKFGQRAYARAARGPYMIRGEKGTSIMRTISVRGSSNPASPFFELRGPRVVVDSARELVGRLHVYEIRQEQGVPLPLVLNSCFLDCRHFIFCLRDYLRSMVYVYEKVAGDTRIWFLNEDGTPRENEYLIFLSPDGSGCKSHGSGASGGSDKFTLITISAANWILASQKAINNRVFAALNCGEDGFELQYMWFWIDQQQREILRSDGIDVLLHDGRVVRARFRFIIKGDGKAQNKMSGSGTHSSTFPIPDALAKKEEVQRTSELDLYAVRSASEILGKNKTVTREVTLQGKNGESRKKHVLQVPHPLLKARQELHKGVRDHAKKTEGSPEDIRKFAASQRHAFFVDCKHNPKVYESGAVGKFEEHDCRHATNGCFAQDFQHIWSKANDR